DGILVVNHDEDHGDMEIAETSFAVLKKRRLSNGEKLPTLKQYLKHGKRDPEVKLIVELKPAKTKILEDEIVKKALYLVKKLRVASQTEFISFSLNICREIRKQAPDLVVHYLNGDLSPQQLKAENLDGLDYHYKVLTEKHPEWIREARALGLKTNAWTVNDPEIYQQLKNQGIDFVTTNIPEQLLKN
ncbi:MAG: glycerophosphodiester phosphodiesterase, partial [Kaistella sp.]